MLNKAVEVEVVAEGEEDEQVDYGAGKMHVASVGSFRSEYVNESERLFTEDEEEQSKYSVF
jgi:hypothetical protein